MARIFRSSAQQNPIPSDNSCNGRPGIYLKNRSSLRFSVTEKSTLHRYFTLFGIQPHRTRSFTLLADPLFVENVRDIVGLYLNPPANALALCVNDKTQFQALERCQPILAMGLGYIEGVTHDYFRHGRHNDALCSPRRCYRHRHWLLQ